MKRQQSIRISLLSISICIAASGFSQGSQLWQTSINSPTNRNDNYLDMRVDEQGNTYLTGYSAEGRAIPGLIDGMITKVLPDGSIGWVSAPNTILGSGEFGKKIAIGSDAIYVAANAYRTVIGYDRTVFMVQKIRKSDGVELWRRTYNGPNIFDAIATNIAVDENDNVYVTGTEWVDDAFTPGNDAIVRKYSPNGDLLWHSLFHEPFQGIGQGQGFHFVKIGPDGNPIVLGSKQIGGLTQFVLRKYNAATGNVIWEKRNDEPVYPKPQNIELGPNGDILMSSNVSTVINNELRQRIMITRFSNSTGAVLWNTIETLPYFYQFATLDQMAVDVNGNPMATLQMDLDGTSVFQIRFNNNMRTYKWDGATGQKLWEVDHGTLENFDSQLPVATQADWEGNVYAVGQESYPASSHVMIRKHESGTGNLMWYALVGTGNHSAFRARVDQSGNLLIAGHTENANLDLWVSKFGMTQRTILPISYTLNAGTLFAGDLSSLLASDSERMSILCDSNDSVGTLTLDGQGDILIPSQVKFQFETASDHPSMMLLARGWNWQTSSFETLGGFAQSLVDQSHTAAATGNPLRFVNSSNGAVKWQLSFIPTEDLSSIDGYSSSIDRTSVLIN